MEEGRRHAVGPVVAAGGGGGDVAAGRSCCCNLCGDVGFREALLPCGARGCTRLQHTYCGRYCPEVVDDVGRWRCEWCARQQQEQEGSDDGRVGEGDDSSSKRSRRALPSPQGSPESERSSSADRERMGAAPLLSHKEDRKEPSGVRATAHAPPGDTTAVSVKTTNSVPVPVHKEVKPGVSSSTSRGGGGSRALDRWKNLAKRTRLGGKKYKLLTDVLC